MKRGLGLDFARQTLIAFLCLSFTHWVVNLASYVLAPKCHAPLDRTPRRLTARAASCAALRRSYSHA